MKKKLESELISLAHRVLKLTGKEDLNKMQNEIALLYQKITVLKFFQDQFNGEIPEEIDNNSSFFSSIKSSSDNESTNTEELNEKTYEKDDNNQEDALMEPAIEKIKDIVAQMPQEANAIDELFDDISPTNEDDGLVEISKNYGQIPMFDPIEKGDGNLESEASFSNEEESLKKNLNSGGFEIGLNDRLAFVNHLFENNNEDYDRVISQLKTMDSFEEISDFIENIIKPEYNNWQGKNDYESRFLEIIERKFN